MKTNLPINKNDIFMGPEEFDNIRNVLVDHGNLTPEALDMYGFTYENHLKNILFFGDYYDSVKAGDRNLVDIAKYSTELKRNMGILAENYSSPRAMFFDFRQQLINQGVASELELKKAGFTYDRYLKFGPNSFFRNIEYQRSHPIKRGPKPMSQRHYQQQSLFGEGVESIGENYQLFDIPTVPEKVSPLQLGLGFGGADVNKEIIEGVKTEIDPYSYFDSINRKKIEQTSLFAPVSIEPSAEEILNKKIEVKDAIKAANKKKIIEIKEPTDLGQVVKTYPLQFFDSKDSELNNKVLDFFNQHLKNEKNSKGITAQMVGFSDTGARIRQLKADGLDRDYFGETDVIGKKVMILTPKAEKSERALAVVRQGDNFFKLAEADLEYTEEGQPLIKNLSFKASATFASPFEEVIVKNTLNDVPYVNVRNIGDSLNGVQEVLNENYSKFFDIIFNKNGSADAITDIATEITKSHRLVNGRVLDMISDATMIQTAHGVSPDAIYTTRLPISGKNLVESMFNLNEEQRKLIKEKGYDKGRYSLDVNDEGKIKNIYKAVTVDGKTEYIKDGEMYSTIFNKEISQYTDSYIMEKAKVVDSDLKNIVSAEDIVRFNERIRNMDRTSDKEVTEAAQEMRNTIFNNFAKEYGYENYIDLLKDIKKNSDLKDIYSSFFEKIQRVDLETMKARIEAGQLFDNRIVEIKDKTTSAGIERLISGAFLHPLNYLNKDSGRKTQGIQQMSSFGFTNFEDEKKVMARMIEQQTNHIKELQSKKINIRKTAEEGLVNLFGRKILGDQFIAPDLSANTVSYLYGDFEETFNDSTIVSALASIKNIGDKEARKTIRLDYSSFNGNILKGLSDDYANVGTLIERLQNGGLNLYLANQEGSFESTFLRNLLGDTVFEKLIQYKTTNSFEEDIEGIKKHFEKIEHLKTDKDVVEYAAASEKARVDFNRAIKKHMILSDSASNINIINKDVVNKDTKSYVADATAGLIENIRADKNGIEITLSLASLQNNGSKFMIDSTKATQGGVYDAIALANEGQNIIVDALVNNKLNNQKRGNAGTVLATSIETMFRNTMTADFGKDLSAQERIDLFKDIFSRAENKLGGKASILELLNLDFKLDNDGSFLIVDKNVEKALSEVDKNDIFNSYTTLEGRIRENFSKNFNNRLGRNVTDLDSEILYQGMVEFMYNAYNQVLGEMTPESRAVNQVMFKNPEIKKYYTGVDGKEHWVTEKVKGYVYNFKGRMVRMSESTSRKNENAMKISRITKLLGATSGNEEFMKLVNDLAVEQNKGNILDFAAVYDIDERGAFRSKALFDSFVEDAKYIDLTEEKYRNLGFGISDTLEGFQKGPLGNVITEVRSSDKSVSAKKIKAVIGGFEEDFLKDLQDFFSNTKKINEDFSKIMFFGALDEMFDKTVMDVSGYFNLGEGRKLNVAQQEASRKLANFKRRFFETGKNLASDLVNTNVFGIDNAGIRNQDFSGVHSYLIDKVGNALGIKSTKEFEEFKKVENEIEELIVKGKDNGDSLKKLLNLANSKLGTNYSEAEAKTHYKQIVGQIRSVIKAKKIDSFGDEALLDILKDTKHLNNDYYKFAVSVTNMLDRLSGNAENNKFDLFSFDNLMEFDNINLDILKKYSNLSDNEIVDTIISEYQNLSGGKIAHLARLKQLSIYGTLPVYATGILTDAEARLIPNSSLADLIAMVRHGAELYSNKEVLPEYAKITKYEKVADFKYNNKTYKLSTAVQQFGKDNKLKKPKDAIQDFLAVFSSGADFNKIFKDNKYPFYNLAARLFEKTEEDHGIPSVIFDEEIRRKFIEFKKKIKSSDVGVSSSLGVFLRNLEVENSEHMNKLINLFTGEDLTLDEFVKGTRDLRKVLRSVGDKYNRSSLTTINHTLNELETFLDDIVKDQVMPLLSDLQKIAKYSLDPSFNTDGTFNNLLTKFISSEKHKGKMENVATWLSPFIENILERSSNPTNEIQHKIISRIISFYESSGQGFFGKGGYLQEAGTYVAENSARISPRNSSNVQTIVTDAITEAFGKKLSERSLNKKLKQIENFSKVIFGEDVGKEIHKKLEEFKAMKGYSDEGLRWISEFLEDKQNIVVGTERMYQTSNLRLDFSKKGYSAYGFLQRDPSQFHGSIAATRFVKIDFNKQMFNNNLYKRLFYSSDGVDNTGNLMFIGRTTGLWANGDFDGDTYQVLLNGLRNKKLFNEFKENSGDLLDASLRLQNLIVNSGDTNLIKEFEKKELTTENSKAIKRMILKLYAGDDLNENSSNALIFSKVKDYYLKHKYYRSKIKESLAEELVKHADTQLSDKAIDGISMLSLADLNLSFSTKDIMRMRAGNFSLEEFSKLLDSTTTIRKESIEELKSNGVEKAYEAFKKTLTPQGQLGLSNLFGSTNKVLEYASIARTGRFHDSISEFREFSIMFRNEKLREVFLNEYASEIGNYYFDGNKNKLNKLFDAISTGLLDDVFGDLIEKGSIGGKHGAKANPYQVIENLNEVSKVTGKGRRKVYLNLDKVNSFIESLLIDMTDANSKVISELTIENYARMMFEGGENGGNYKLQKVIKEMTTAIGKMFDITKDAGEVKLADIEGMTASKLAGVLYTVNVAAAKGHMEKISNTTNIARGLVHKITSKKSNGSKLTTFFGAVHKESKGGRASGTASSDTYTAIDILRSYLPDFLFAKESNKDVKEQTEKQAEKVAKVSEEELKEINAYNTKIDIDAAINNLKKAESEGSSESVDSALKEAQDIIKALNKRNAILNDSVAQKSKEIEDLTNKVGKAAQTETGETIKKASKASKVVTEEAEKTAQKAKSEISKNKKLFTIGGAALALGFFFRIFQSNRPVVNLDINEKQYEKSQGSVYRDLNQYTINTNIRGLY